MSEASERNLPPTARRRASFREQGRVALSPLPGGCRAAVVDGSLPVDAGPASCARVARPAEKRAAVCGRLRGDGRGSQCESAAGGGRGWDGAAALAGGDLGTGLVAGTAADPVLVALACRVFELASARSSLGGRASGCGATAAASGTDCRDVCGRDGAVLLRGGAGGVSPAGGPAE